MSSYRVRTIHIPGLHAHVCYVLSVVLSKSYFRVCIEIPTVGIQFFATTLESMHSIISSISTTVRLKYCRNNTSYVDLFLSNSCFLNLDLLEYES